VPESVLALMSTTMGEIVRQLALFNSWHGLMANGSKCVGIDVNQSIEASGSR